MNGLTRHQAAEILGCTDQTVSNYCKEGLLGSCKGKGGILYVNADDVEMYKDQLRMTAASERLIELKQKKIAEMRAKLDEEESELRDGLLFHIHGYSRDFIIRIIANFARSGILYKMKGREAAFLTKFIQGESFDEIAKEYDLSYQRVQQVTNKAAQRFLDTAAISESMRSYSDVVRENDTLRKEVEMLRDKCSNYEKRDELPKDETEYLSSLLSTRLVDLNLSTRALICLVRNEGLETLDDLLKIPKVEILKFRNLGKKTLSEIDDIVESLSLEWRLRDESDADYYARLIKIRNGGDEWL